MPPATPASALERALADADNLQAILDDDPVLLSRAAVAERLLHTAEHLVGSGGIVVWAPDGQDGYEALASLGVPAAVLTRGPRADLPFLAAVAANGGTPVFRNDLSQEDYEGLAGLRGDSAIAVPLSAAGELLGIVVLSTEGLTQEDMMVLADLASEHAPGLALATHFEILEARRRLFRESAR